MGTRSDVFDFIVEEFFDGDGAKAADAMGRTARQIESWRRSGREPQKASIKHLLSVALVPKFKIICEYKFLIYSGETLTKQLKKFLKGHEYASGLYAFYDSMANLIYIGKSDGNMLTECAQSIKRQMPEDVLPDGVPEPSSRHKVIRYVSAYAVPSSDFDDYAKHIEAVILRISKPRLNNRLGRLEYA